MKPIRLIALAMIFACLALPAKEAKAPKNPDRDKSKEKDKDKDREKDKDKEQPISWREHLTQGPAVLLRLKNETGKFLIYDGTLSRTQAGANSFVENDEFYLTVLCADKNEETVNGKNKVLDLLAMRRTFTERKREEKLENGKTIQRILENSEDLITLGPNYKPVGALRCYAYDEQNCAAYRTENLIQLKDGRQVHATMVLDQTSDKMVVLTDSDKLTINREEIKSSTLVPMPHVLLEESPHYLFPPLSEIKRAPGETWRFKVPVIVPLKQGNPPQVLPTQFYAVVTCRLCEVKQNVALIEYRVSGTFDSKAEEFAGRFPNAFHEDNRFVHKMAGEGILQLDVEKGRILEKRENFTFTLFGSSAVPQGIDKPPKIVENQIEVTSQFHIRLMMPGEKMKNGKPIPNYD